MILRCMSKPTLKLICYIDEGGQPKDSIFTVGVFVHPVSSSNEVLDLCLTAEEQSGKHDRKWSKASRKSNLAYIQNIFSHSLLHGCIYFCSAGPVDKPTIHKALVAKQSILIHRGNNTASKVKLFVDGELSAKEKQIFGRQVRQKDAKLFANEARGIDDEVSPEARLSDAIASFTRGALLGISSYQSIFNSALESGALIRVEADD